jgi:hypothetical protein
VIVPMLRILALQGGKLLETVGLGAGRSTRIYEWASCCMHESQTTLAKEIVADLDSFHSGGMMCRGVIVIVEADPEE